MKTITIKGYKYEIWRLDNVVCLHPVYGGDNAWSTDFDELEIGAETGGDVWSEAVRMAWTLNQ